MASDYELLMKAHRQLMLGDYERYIAEMFRIRQNKNFIFGEHHHRICEALMRVVRGETRKLIINIAPRYGKAIDINTPMLTVEGWKLAGELKVGDFLFGDDGKPTQIKGVYLQGETDAYEVVFTDGTKIVTCGEHLWQVHQRRRYYKKGYNGNEILKTKELVGKLQSPDGHHIWNIPLVKPIQMPDADLPIPPYLFGCWLGDGSSYKAEITTMDEEIIDSFKKYGFKKYKHQNSGRAVTYGIKGGFISLLKSIGVIGNKRIPKCYLLASKEQRFELLKGLCDTDGTCNKKNGQVSICLTKDDLREDLKSLIASLGMFYTEYRKSVFIRSEECPFKLERKSKHWKPLNNHHFSKRFIHSINRIENRETVCFEVDNKNHLFCAGKDLIVTHNTEIAVKMFISYGLAINPASRFLHLSYSGSLVMDNSMEVKDIMNTEYYRALFDARLSKRLDTRSRWETIQGGGLYATSTLGQITGFGAGVTDADDEEAIDEYTAMYNPGKFAGAIVIDDPLKPEEALSENIRETVNRRFETTIRNRVNSKRTPIVIIMQRLHEHDLCGYLMDVEPGSWEVLSLPCIYYKNGEERALCEFKHNLKELHDLRRINPWVFETQYMQNPKPLEGRLFAEGDTMYFSESPVNPDLVFIQVDPADEGKDCYCSKVYVISEGYCYNVETMYTEDRLEITVPRQKDQIRRWKPAYVNIESNSAWRLVAKDIKEWAMNEGLDSEIRSFKVHTNKELRIFNEAPTIRNKFKYLSPDKQNDEYSRCMAEKHSYIKLARNQKDDGVDCDAAASYWAKRNGLLELM